MMEHHRLLNACAMLLPQLECLRLRPATAHDDGFLKTLFLSTREDLARLAADPKLFATLVEMQWRARQAAYRAAFPGAQDMVVEDGEGPAGRLLLDTERAPWRVVDLALLPRARGRGHGRAVLLALQEAATMAGAAVELTVRRDNVAARGLYASLGFAAIGGDAVAEAMRWTPQGA